jgi:photosystem II stability/assembly factor-like uncharacterized protein
MRNPRWPVAWLVAFIFFCLVSITASAQWVPLGPDGGDVRSLAYDPQNPDRLFLGTSAGQLYVSNDHGRSWSRYARLGSGQDLVLDNIEIDPADTRTMYVAAWSVETQTSGGDLFRTSDGGRTWQSLSAMHGKSIRALAVAQSDHRVVVAGALDGVFRSKDGGETWERISPPNHAEIKNIESIAIDPRDPNVVYAGTWHLAWKTNDGGANWHPIKNGVVDDSDVFSIIVDHTNPSVVYLSACSGIYRSENGAELFRKVQGIPFSARRTRVLQQDPKEANVVYAGTTEGLWRTTDSGKNWKRISAANIIVNDVLVDPRDSAKVFVATDRSGVLASTDGGVTFQATNRGFAHRQVSAVLVDRKDHNRIYAGLVNDKEFGGVFESNNSGSDWRQITDGLAGKDIFTLAQSESGTLLAGTNRGVYAYSPSERAWKAINTVLSEKQVRVPAKTKKAKPSYRTEYAKSELSGRVSQLAVDGVWYAATSSGLYISKDEGRNWRVADAQGQRYFVSVDAQADTVAAATLTSLLVSKDKGKTWTAVATPRWVSAVFSVAVLPDAIWLATREGALRSPDSGATWEHVLSGLPSRNIGAIRYDEENRRLLAISSSGELFESRNAGQTWRRFDAGWVVRNVIPSHGKLLAITAFDGILMLREDSAKASLGGGGFTTR